MKTSHMDDIATYLRGLKWDGKPRIGKWLEKYAGAKKSSEIGKSFLRDAVARVFDPGCVTGPTLVMKAPQGAGKTNLFEILSGGRWSALYGTSRDDMMILADTWFIELSDLVCFRRKNNNTLKAFISSRVDSYRPPYGKNVEKHPRKCVFFCTTADCDFLSDETGNRRFWFVDATSIDTVSLLRDRDQLWAEAVEMYSRERRSDEQENLHG